MKRSGDVIAMIKERVNPAGFDLTTAEGRADFDDALRAQLRKVSDTTLRNHAADLLKAWRRELIDGPPKDVTLPMIVDALGCFWNAALGEAHQRQEGFAFASIMATGVEAIRARLEELSRAQAASREITTLQGDQE
jgi:hypothetical protein